MDTEEVDRQSNAEGIETSSDLSIFREVGEWDTMKQKLQAQGVEIILFEQVDLEQFLRERLERPCEILTSLLLSMS